MELYQVVLLVIGVLIAGLYIYKRVTGKDILRYIMLSKPIIKGLGVAVETIYRVWPASAPLKVVYTVTKAAIEGAEVAEKAWQIGNLNKEDRNAFAKALVRDTLNQAGITVTPQVEAIVAGVIEAVCIVLPHENTSNSVESNTNENKIVGNIG